MPGNGERKKPKKVNSSSHRGVSGERIGVAQKPPRGRVEQQRIERKVCFATRLEVLITQNNCGCGMMERCHGGENDRQPSSGLPVWEQMLIHCQSLNIVYRDFSKHQAGGVQLGRYQLYGRSGKIIVATAWRVTTSAIYATSVPLSI